MADSTTQRQPGLHLNEPQTETAHTLTLLLRLNFWHPKGEHGERKNRDNRYELHGGGGMNEEWDKSGVSSRVVRKLDGMS
jgi:hypothetical protein